MMKYVFGAAWGIAMAEFGMPATDYRFWILLLLVGGWLVCFAEDW